MVITERVERQTRHTLSMAPPERGLLLLGDAEDGIVRAVHFDHTAATSGTSYSPDCEALNFLWHNTWRGTFLPLGFKHSHPGDLDRPSSADIEYAGRILEANPWLPRLLMPIVTLRGGYRVTPYAVWKVGGRLRVARIEYRVVREEIVVPTATRTVRRTFQLFGYTITTPLPRPWWRREEFARVQEAYDLERLARSCGVVVGSGGARSLVEDLVRCGLGHVVVIDFDHVSRSNIGSQHVFGGEVGKTKVRALKAQLRRINRFLTVTTCAKRFEDVTDAELADLCGITRGRPANDVLLIGTTDSFAAQAEVNRRALRMGLPSLCAQVYERGEAGEVTFTYPGVTPYCHRCRLADRYRAYEDGYENTVTSAGAPVTSTSRINALAGYVALAMLHHGSGHARWGHILTDIADRNLVQVRMHPDASLPTFDAVLCGNRLCVHSDEAIWLPLAAAPEPGSCPDCGATGDLRDAVRPLPSTGGAR